jgi:hypothetical protein
MANNEKLHYKPGLTMDAPISVTMAAADWTVFLSWLVNLPSAQLLGVTHLAWGIIAHQVSEAVYTQASLKAAQADHAEHAEQVNPLMLFQKLTGQGILRPEDFAGKTMWVIECGECYSRDEYPAGHAGLLKCGHDGERSVTEMRRYPE